MGVSSKNRVRALLALSRTFCARHLGTADCTIFIPLEANSFSFLYLQLYCYRMIVTEIGIKTFIQDLRTLSANPGSNID